MATVTITTPPGWASVRGGKWHATINPEPSWYPRDNTEETICGLTIMPVNVVFADQQTDLNGGPACEHCWTRLSPEARSNVTRRR